MKSTADLKVAVIDVLFAILNESTTKEKHTEKEKKKVSIKRSVCL